MHVIIIGAGIAGMTSALNLALQGVDVTLIDQDTIPGNRCASNDDHRLLRHGYPGHDGYARMVHAAIAAWQRLFAVTGEDGFVATGILAMSSAPDDFSAACTAQYEQLGLPFERLDPGAVAERFEILETAHLRDASLQPDGGVLLASRILRAIGRCFESMDIELVPGLRVDSADLDRARIVLEDGSIRQADRVLMTAGPWGGRFVSSAITPVRAAVTYMDLRQIELESWETMPAILDFGGDAGIYAIPPVAGLRLKFGRESFDRPGNVEAGRLPASREGVQLTEPLWPLLRHPDAYEIFETRICYYSRGTDSRYTVSQGARGLALTGCSGHMFKMGAVIGEGLAAWATGAVTTADMVPWLKGEAALSRLPEKFRQPP